MSDEPEVTTDIFLENIDKMLNDLIQQRLKYIEEPENHEIRAFLGNIVLMHHKESVYFAVMNKTNIKDGLIPHQSEVAIKEAE